MTMVKIKVNGRWPLWVPPHRAEFAKLETGWEVARLDDMHERLEPGMAVWDIGAEVGDLTALYATWGCEVGIVEPSGVMWPNIRATWEANVDRAPLFGFCGFAGDEPRGERWLATGRRWPGRADGAVATDPGFCRPEERPDLPVARLDDMADASTPPDAITIDVEGSELAVLRGAERTLVDHNPVVWVSVHPEMMFGHYGIYTDDLFAYMRGLGYGWDVLDYDHEWHVRFECR